MLSVAVPVGLLATESVAVTVQLAPAPEACATARPVVAPMVAALAGVQEIVQVTGFAGGDTSVPLLMTSVAANTIVWPAAIVAVKGATVSFNTVGAEVPTVK